ncbi:MAG: CPBP family glutamic-type intramembrane protease [Planctomycetota bacterium]
MADRYRREHVSAQLVPSVPNSYAERTSRPIYALIYLLGFLAVYYFGLIMMQPGMLNQSLAQPAGQVVAFYWVRSSLAFLGFNEQMTWIAAPLVVIVILLALQFTSKTSWKVKWGDFALMAGECILLAIPLIVLSLLLNRGAAEPNAAMTAAESSVSGRLTADIVAGIGAGIYEELIFRLVLICLLMLIFQDLFGLQKKTSAFWAVILSAVAFSLHHHLFFANGQLHHGDTFTFGKFMFRALAGVYFAILYAVRGFGVTAGTHAFYYILAALLRTAVFMVQAE